MPYIQSLPFRGSTSLSRYASAQGAVMAGKTVHLKRAAYWAYLVAKKAATDEEAEHDLGMKRSSVCSTRDYFMKQGLIEPCGLQLGGSGVKVTVWRVRA